MKLKGKLPETCLLPKNGRKGVWVSCEALDWLHENDIACWIDHDQGFVIPDDQERIFFITKFEMDWLS
jgi:hypothetical protein